MELQIVFLYDYENFGLLNEIFSLYLKFKTICTKFHPIFLIKFTSH